MDMPSHLAKLAKGNENDLEKTFYCWLHAGIDRVLAGGKLCATTHASDLAALDQRNGITQ